MELRKICKRIVITGTLVIWIIKFLVRPYISMDDNWQFLSGIAPNMLGSFLVPFGAYWLYTHRNFFNGQLLRFDFFSDNRIVCFTGFTLVTINEYLQLIPLFGRTFDIYDLLFSAVGFIFSYYSFHVLQRRAAAFV